MDDLQISPISENSVKIVIIGPVYPYRGGIAHFTTSLAIEMKKNGHDVSVVSFKRQYPQFLYPGKSDKDPSREPLVFPAEHILDPLYPWTWEKARRYILNEHPDLVLFQWWTTFWAPTFGILARSVMKSNLHLVYLVHNVFPHETNLFDKILTKFALVPANHFVVMSETQRLLLAQIFANKNIAVISHPTYSFGQNKYLDKNLAKQQLGIPPDRYLALFFGIVRPYKGLEILLKAIGLLKRQGAPIHLFVAGEFWESIEKYFETIREEGIEDWVTIDDRYIPNEELTLLFNAANVFVAPYVSGTQSGAAKMAVGYRLPIVVTPVIADEVFRSTAKDGVFVSTSTSPEAIKEALEQARGYVPRNGAEAKTDFSWKNLVESIVLLSQDNQEKATVPWPDANHE